VLRSLIQIVINARRNMKISCRRRIKISILKEMSIICGLFRASANQAWDPNTFFEEQRYFDLSANLKMPLYLGR
jgi:hypothetical protein